ncbi:MAG: hypothetical protein M3Y80_06290 [Verrucomicrobiota bacterium]|nr:hypothetical protein [Verrucomicrobiota bacterium]
MRITHAALITAAALGLALPGAFARQAKSSTKAKNSVSSASAKKKKGAAAKSRGKSAKSRAAAAKQRPAGEHFDGVLEEIPAEDLPAEEDSPDGE